LYKEAAASWRKEATMKEAPDSLFELECAAVAKKGKDVNARTRIKNAMEKRDGAMVESKRGLAATRTERTKKVGSAGAEGKIGGRRRTGEDHLNE
jgi:hypothetical protein